MVMFNEDESRLEHMQRRRIKVNRTIENLEEGD